MRIGNGPPIRARAAAAVLAVLASASAAAETDRPADFTTQPGAVDRVLDGHVFSSGTLVRSPFAVTAFEANLMYGSGTATGPTYDRFGIVVGDETYTFAAEAQTFSYDKKLAEGVSVGGGVVSQLYSGIDGPSVVVVGTEIGAGLFARGTAGRRLGPVHAALTFDGSYAPRYGILVLDAIQKALQDRELDSEAAFNQTNAWTLKPGIAAAWAPHPALGLVASLDYQWVSLDATDSGWQEESGVDLAIAADLDLGTFTSVPAAFLASYHRTEPIGSSGVSPITDFTGGVFYTGRPALVLGLEVGYRSLSVRELDATATVAQIRLQYLW